VHIRFGYDLGFAAAKPTRVLLTLHAHYTRSSDLIRPDNALTDPSVRMTMHRDGFGIWPISADIGMSSLQRDATHRRTLIALGRDTAGVAISTTFSSNTLDSFRVRSEKVPAAEGAGELT
jgi:hypothetical protein